MSCSKCGTQTADDALYCSNCGSALTATTPKPTVQAIEPAPTLPPKADAMPSIVGVGIVVFGILLMIAFCSSNSANSGPNTTATQHPSNGTEDVGSTGTGGENMAPPPDYCQEATDHSIQSLKDLEAGDYQGGYSNAVSGLSLNDQCTVENQALVNKGYLLGHKALNEHHLSVGDSRVDINQAITLLAECQSAPGLYGTETGAQCETEEEALISYKTNWEMANY